MKKPKLSVRNYQQFKLEPLQGKGAEKTLSKASKALSRYKWWLSAGTLLGIYRDGRLIPHDTDIDVGVDGEDISVFEIAQDLADSGFKLIRTVIYGDKPMQVAFIDTNEVIFDIYFFYKDKDYSYNYSPAGYMHKPLKFTNFLKEISFNNHLYPIPNFTAEYLKYRYGDWEIPAEKKINWEEEATCLVKYEQS